MKIKWFNLFIVFIIFYILISVRSDNSSIGELFNNIFVISNYTSFTPFALTTLVSFYLYSLLSYLSLTIIKSKIMAWISVVLTFPIAIAFRYLVEEVIFRYFFGYSNYHADYKAIDYFWDNTYFGQVFLALGIVFYFYQKSKYEENQKLQLILEQKQSELSFLKSQINPHFLFNTLNNIYSLVNKRSPNSLIAIEKLSSLLRYSLYENKDKVHINTEIEMLNNIIELHNLRTTDGINIIFDVENDNNTTFEIAPLLLLPFVENAIKHGSLIDNQNPIILKLNITEKSFIFNISNKIQTKKKDNIGGIGLENIKRRLNLIYPDNHSLIIKQEKNQFEVLLKIKR